MEEEAGTGSNIKYKTDYLRAAGGSAVWSGYSYRSKKKGRGTIRGLVGFLKGFAPRQSNLSIGTYRHLSSTQYGKKKTANSRGDLLLGSGHVNPLG